MQINSAVYEGGKLILQSDDITAKRFPFKFKPGNYRLEKERKKRSLDSNAYAWELIGKIADVVGSDKDSIYLEMLKRYGQGGVVKIPNADVDRFCRTYKYHQPHESLPPEERAQYFRFWVGSSQYNQQEMNVFINGIVDECKTLDIETMTPAELERLGAAWGGQLKNGQ